MLIGQVNRISVMFVTLGILDKVFKFQPDVCNGCHDVWMMSITLSNIAILNIQQVLLL